MRFRAYTFKNSGAWNMVTHYADRRDNLGSLCWGSILALSNPHPKARHKTGDLRLRARDQRDSHRRQVQGQRKIRVIAERINTKTNNKTIVRSVSIANHSFNVLVCVRFAIPSKVCFVRDSFLRRPHCNMQYPLLAADHHG